MKTFIYLLCSLWLSLAVHAAELKIEPATPTVEVDKEIELSVIGTVGQVKWVATEGHFLNSGTKVTYRAPSEKPATGFVVVEVSDESGNDPTVKEVTITKRVNISVENGTWKVFTNRSEINALLLSDDGKTLWVGTNGGLEKRDAQTGKILKVFTIRNGLPNNYITALLSDEIGGLWIGTVGGLAHYTVGEQWQVFNTKNSELPSNLIQALLSDNRYGLWIGVNCWNEECVRGGLVHYTDDRQWEVFNTENSGLPSNDVWTLLSDDQEGLWIGTEGGLAHYTSAGQWQVFNKNNRTFHQELVHGLLSDNQGGLWIGTNEGLAHYTAAGQWQVFNQENSGLPIGLAYALLSDNKGGLWIGTDLWGANYRTGSGLVHYSAAGQWQVFNTKNSELLGDSVRALLSDNKGGLWIGTEKGLVRYTSDRRWEVFNQTSSELPNGSVQALSSDNQGGLWVSTHREDALAYYNSATGQWQVFNTENSELPSDSVGALLSDNQGGLWIGTDTVEGLFAHYNTTNKKWQVFKLDNFNSKFPSIGIGSLLGDKKGGLWIGTDDGLVHYSTTNKKWQVFNQKNSKLPDNDIEVLSSDNQCGLWIGTSKGLAHYNTTNKKWQVFNQKNSKLPSNWVRALLSDNQGGLWIGTDDEGLALYNTTSKQWEVFNQKNSKLPSNLVRALSSDNQGGLWIGTYGGGLAHYNPNKLDNKKWDVLFNTKNSELPSDYVDALLSDNQDGLWVGTVGGLSRLSFQSKRKGNRAAIIIASGGSHYQNSSLWKATEFATVYAYKMLVNRKFVNEEIYYLSSKTWADFDGDGVNDWVVDEVNPERPLGLGDIKKAFKWAEWRGKLDQPLYVFFMDHGDDKKLILNLKKNESISATELNKMLNDYQTATGSQVVLVIEACYSGSLMPALAAPNRAIITSAKFDEVALPIDGQTFLSFLIKKLETTNFKDAFKMAQSEQNRLIGKLGKTQSPQLDDNGDGEYDPKDGQWLQHVQINGDVGNLQTTDSRAVAQDSKGHTQVTYAKKAAFDFSLAVETLTPTTTVNADQVLTFKTKVVSAKDDAQLVWAVVRPPRMNQVIDTNGTPILAYPHEPLAPSMEKDVWQTRWKAT